MKRKLLLLLVAGLASAAHHDHPWKTAKVLDANTAKTYVDADGFAIQDKQLAIANAAGALAKTVGCTGTG